MPGRAKPLITNEVYHVFNRGIDRRPTFTNKFEYIRALETLKYYRYEKPLIRLSKFLEQDFPKRSDILQSISKNDKLVEVICFCLMPNHFHLLLKQKKDSGISKFLSNFQNSYTRFFNSKNKRDGSLFLDQFKAVRIETEEQCLHVSRYIHLNPHTGFVIKNLQDLEKYPWSSFHDYCKESNEFISIDLLLAFFANGNDYKKFIFDNADYQRSLKKIEHITFE